MKKTEVTNGKQQGSRLKLAIAIITLNGNVMKITFNVKCSSRRSEIVRLD